MANKDRNKRSARKARQRERAELEAARESASAATPAESAKKKGATKAVTKAAKAEKPVSAKAAKPGLVARTRTYFRDVKTEMHRVVWPSRTELKNYSVAVIITLVVFGAAIWLVDTGFVALLVAFTSLRG